MNWIISIVGYWIQLKWVEYLQIQDFSYSLSSLLQNGVLTYNWQLTLSLARFKESTLWCWCYALSCLNFVVMSNAFNIGEWMMQWLIWFLVFLVKPGTVAVQNRFSLLIEPVWLLVPWLTSWTGFFSLALKKTKLVRANCVLLVLLPYDKRLIGKHETYSSNFRMRKKITNVWIELLKFYSLDFKIRLENQKKFICTL